MNTEGSFYTYKVVKLSLAGENKKERSVTQTDR